MQKLQDELMKRFRGKLNSPKRLKSEQSNQQKNPSLDYARRAEFDTLVEQRLHWLENLNSEVRLKF